MKKLNYIACNVKRLTLAEMQEKRGGGWCDFRDKFIVRPLEFVAQKVVTKYVNKFLDKVIKL